MSPPLTSARLATLETDGWTIDDGEQAHAAHPERYRIPPRGARTALGPGDLVKIRFFIRVRTQTGETEDQGERMWVEIQERHGDWYLGTLDNDPCCTDAIQSGMPLWFQARHVIDIDLGPLSRRRFRKMKAARWATASLSLMTLCVVVGLCTDHGQAWFGYWQSKLRGGYRLEERLGQLAPEVEPGLRQVFAAADVAFPPAELSLLAFKHTRTLEVYARSEPASPWRYVATLPVLGLSGQPGPKLLEGDRQVPEGVYQVAFLNPNGRFDVSIRLDYPNRFDREHARQDGRTRLGGDIMIHGTSSSVGCLAVGNRAAERLFYLAAQLPGDKVHIVVGPTDLRSAAPPVMPPGQPPWLPDLYDTIRTELSRYPAPANARPFL